MMSKNFKSLDATVPEGKLVQLKDVSKGDWIKRSLDTRKVYRKSHYVRDEGFNRYSCDDVEDINREIFLKGGTIVWVGFTY